MVMRTRVPRPKKNASERAVASRKKGQRGERKLAKKLEAWWGAPFDRTPRSGGLRWGIRHDVRGDVVCEDPRFPFIVEEKNRESWDLVQFLGGKGNIFKWWQQVWRDAQAVGRIPLLFIDKNYVGGYVIFKPRMLQPMMRHRPKRYLTTYMPLSDVKTLTMVSIEDFLATVDVEKCCDPSIHCFGGLTPQGDGTV